MVEVSALAIRHCDPPRREIVLVARRLVPHRLASLVVVVEVSALAVRHRHPPRREIVLIARDVDHMPPPARRCHAALKIARRFFPHSRIGLCVVKVHIAVALLDGLPARGQACVVLRVHPQGLARLVVVVVRTLAWVSVGGPASGHGAVVWRRVVLLIAAPSEGAEHRGERAAAFLATTRDELDLVALRRNRRAALAGHHLLHRIRSHFFDPAE